jgi:hypothetical protein
MRRRRTSGLAATGAAAILMLAACSSGGGNGNGNGNGSNSSSSAAYGAGITSVVNPSTHKGGTLTAPAPAAARSSPASPPRPARSVTTA